MFNQAIHDHRDDIVQTLFLNMFHGARLKAMPPKLRSEDGANIVIRPLCYVPGRDIERYARARAFPIIPCRLCGSQPNLQRKAVARMLAGWDRENPGGVHAIFTAIRNVSASHLADTASFDFVSLRADADSGKPGEGAGSPLWGQSPRALGR